MSLNLQDNQANMKVIALHAKDKDKANQAKQVSKAEKSSKKVKKKNKKKSCHGPRKRLIPIATRANTALVKA